MLRGLIPSHAAARYRRIRTVVVSRHSSIADLFNLGAKDAVLARIGASSAAPGLLVCAMNENSTWEPFAEDPGRPVDPACGWGDDLALTSFGKISVGAPPSSGHRPVLLAEMLAALAVRADGIYLDATFGGGGYSAAILDAGAGRVLGLDRDPAAVGRGCRLAAGRPRFRMLEGRFGDMTAHLAAAGVVRLDGIVLDLGLSSMQLDDPARGFSFAADGPLDMRMSGQGQSAAELVNEADEATLATILYRYGEERAARRIARVIVERRRRAPLATTRELAAVIAAAVGRHGGRIDPATRSFQALRIYLNDELGELERALAAAEALLAPGGRLVVVAFHSLEDRLVKQFLAARSVAAQRAPIGTSASRAE